MPIPARCPDCQSAFRFADDARGKRVRCKSCREPFVVRPDEDDPNDATPAPQRICGERAAPAPAPRRRDGAEVDPPRRSAERRPAGKTPPAGRKPVGSIVGLAALRLVVLGGSGGAAYWLPETPGPGGRRRAIGRGPESVGRR